MLLKEFGGKIKNINTHVSSVTCHNIIIFYLYQPETDKMWLIKKEYVMVTCPRLFTIRNLNS